MQADIETGPPRIQEDAINSVEMGEFRELLKYTIFGYVGGLLVGGLMDYFSLQRSAIGQWIVRTLSGEGESIFEGVYAIRQRLSRSSASMAEAYGWGKFLGMIVPWIIDAGSRLWGINVYGVEGFYIPYFYAMSDQIGANVSGFIFLKRREKNLYKAMLQYVQSPVMLSSIVVILIVPIGLFVARLVGFSPTTQLLTALETNVANLCWVPPLVGMLSEKRGRRIGEIS